MAVDRVSSEPFSGPNSLLTGKIQGNSRILLQESVGGVLYDAERTRVPATQRRFLSRAEQGIITHVSGNSISLIPPSGAVRPPAVLPRPASEKRRSSPRKPLRFTAQSLRRGGRGYERTLTSKVVQKLRGRSLRLRTNSGKGDSGNEYDKGKKPLHK